VLQAVVKPIEVPAVPVGVANWFFVKGDLSLAGRCSTPCAASGGEPIEVPARLGLPYRSSPPSPA
jgi:hypothetical protein